MEWPRAFARKRTKGTVLALGVMLFILVAVTPVWQQVPEIIRHLIIVLTTVLAVHILDQALLWEDLADSLGSRLASANELVREAATIGLTQLSDSRGHFREELKQAIAEANQRVWLEGVAFTSHVHLTDLIPALRAKAQQLDQDARKSSPAVRGVRILLLDPLRSPAVFRTFLESSSEDVESILRSNETSAATENPLFDQPLFRDFSLVYSSLRAEPLLRNAVRFYGHDPLCWLVICDDTAYYQPYTLGRSTAESKLGDQMPVFKFQLQKGGKAFETLVDHFKKLWLTSDVDMMQMGARRADKDRIVRELFARRLPWLRHVYAVIASPGDERRADARQPCLTAKNECSVRADGSTHPALIIDYSAGGLRLRSQDAWTPKKEDRVEVEAGVTEMLAARFIVEELFGSSRVRHGLVKWADANSFGVDLERGESRVKSTQH